MINNRPLTQIAFIKFGTERWMQMMAANLKNDTYLIDYYYCDADNHNGSSDRDRMKYMLDHKVNLIKFKVESIANNHTRDWINTDFWDVFDENKYDLIQTAKAGPAEYPFYKINKPIIEHITLEGAIDRLCQN